MDYTGIAILIGAPIVRSVTGWLENALQDGQIDNFEWSQLGATFLRVGIISTGLYFGADWGATASASSALLGDFILSKLTNAIKSSGVKKTVTKTKAPSTAVTQVTPTETK